MRYFNTSGPCNPQEHFTVLRKELIAEGVEKVRRGRYVTIFAPRQSGKTTYFLLLIKELRRLGEYTPIWISVENLQDVTKRRFYEVVGHKLSRELAEYGIQSSRAIKDEIDLASFFEEIRSQCPALVLVIDEFEGTPKRVLGELMHTLSCKRRERRKLSC